MRAFADLAVRPPVGEDNNQERMAALARQMGLSLICLRFSPKASPTEIEFSTSAFRKVGLDVAVGVDLTPVSRKQLLNQLKTLRRDFDVVSAKCADPRVAALAAKDTRVDLVSLEPQKSFRSKQSILRLLKSNLELELSRVLQSHQPDYESLKTLFQEVELARKCRASIVISSGATSSSALRAPRDMASLAISLGLSKELSLDSVSETPVHIVKLNRERLSGRSLGLGITLVRP